MRWRAELGSWCLALGVVAGLAVAGPASAARPVAVGLSGPQGFRVALSGTSAVWTYSPRRYASPVEIRSASPRGGTRTLLRGEVTPGSGVEQLAVLSAGPGLVATGLIDFARAEETVRVVGASSWAGPGSSPLARIPGVRDREWPLEVAVDRGRVALVLADRTREQARPRLLLYRRSTGKQVSRRLSARAQGFVDLAGGYVATMREVGLDRTEILVRDLRSWRTRTRVLINVDALDIDAALRQDGTLAIVYGRGPYRAALAPLGGRLRLLRPRPSTLEIEATPGGAAFGRRGSRGTRLIEARAGRRARSLAAPMRGLIGFDVSRGRIALRTRRCVYVARVPALEAARPCPSG